MRLTSGKFPGHSRTGIHLHSRNVLVLVELWYGARSCINIYPFCWNTKQSEVQQNTAFMMLAFKYIVVFSLECILCMLLCFHWNVVKVCCCVFIGMYLKYVVVFSLECI